ncbi:unnamed protein product [Prunus armeniaca]
MVEFVSCGFLLSIDIVILNMLPDMFSAEIPYMKCMNFEFEIVTFALSKPDMDANRLGSSLPISLGISNGEWGTTHAREYHLHNTAHHLEVRDWTKATGFFTVRRWLEK